MKRLTLVLMVIFLSIVPISTINGQDMEDPQKNPVLYQDVLLIYDYGVNNTLKDNNLNAIATLLSVLSQTVKIVPMDAYQPGQMAAYQKLIILKNNENAITNQVLQTDCNHYQGEILYLGFLVPGLIPQLGDLAISPQNGQTVNLTINGLVIPSIWVDDLRVIDDPASRAARTVEIAGDLAYPFSKTIDQVTYVPTFIGNQEFQLVLGDLLRNWLGLEMTGKTTLLIPDIYPFSDLEMVIKTADGFYENGIPFALGVVPMADNLDFPAMARFYQVLRYVQSKNGTIFLHRPSPETVSDNSAMLTEKMKATISKMVENGVYPLGLATEQSLFFDDQRDVTPLNFFSTGIVTPAFFISQSGEDESWALTSASLGINFETIEKATSPKRNFVNEALNTTIIMPLAENEDGLQDKIARINDKWLSLTDYKYLDNQWTIGQDTIKSGPAGIFHNGLAVSLAYDEEPVTADYDYKPPAEYSLEKIFNAGNAFLLTVVGVIIIVFTVIVIFSRRVYLRKFRKKINPDPLKESEKTHQEGED